MYRVVNVVRTFLQVIIHVSIMHKHRSLQLSHDVTYICHKRFTENIVYFITIHYWESKRVTGNRQWRITCQAGMLFKKQCHQTIRIWHKYIFTCIILQVNRRLFFQLHHWNTDKKVPPSICVHILSSDRIINMTSIDVFKNIDKNLYIFASQYYVKKKRKRKS